MGRLAKDCTHNREVREIKRNRKDAIHRCYECGAKYKGEVCEAEGHGQNKHAPRSLYLEAA